MCQNSSVLLAFPFRCFFLFVFHSSFLFSQDLDSIKVGSGGGFTNQATVYKIVQKKVWRAQGIASLSYTQMAKLRCREHKQIKKGAQALRNEPTFDHPSNTYKWVEIFYEGKSSKFQWGDPLYPPSNSVLSYYQFLNQLIPTLTFK